MTAAPVFDCLIFSGGGAKGAYGAGAAKALWEYRALKEIDTEICYLGASAGALNAALLAMHGADELVRFWRHHASRGALGVGRHMRLRSALRWLRRRWPWGEREPYSIYSHRPLARLLEERADFQRLAGKHLIIAATDFSAGRLRAFYHSDLIPAWVAEDAKLPTRRQRLAHFRPLAADNLVPALLASAALPLVFPPVRIDGTWYIDGGVGNNTPTPEASRFLRHLEQHRAGRSGTVYCIRLEPPRVREDALEGAGAMAILDRTLSIYHDVHTGPIVGGWYRINREIRAHNKRLDEFAGWVDDQEWPAAIRTAALEQIQDLRPQGGETARVDVPLFEVQPSDSLGETLDFSAERIDANIKIGFRDMLRRLHGKEQIDETELDRLMQADVLVD